MTTVFEFAHYRPLLREQALRWKKEKPGWTLARIAEKSGIQAPYLTNVLKEKVHLSADQLHALAEVFDWSEDEREFALLLLDWERSGLPKRREFLKGRIDRIRRDKLQAKANLKKEVIEATPEEFTRFFLNPFYSLINSFMAIPRFARDPRRIARCLALDTRQVQGYVKDLVEMKFLGPGPDGYQKLRKNFHLPKDSPLCEPHGQLLLQQMQQQMQRLPADQVYSNNVTFSADPATREKIQRAFLKFLQTVEPLVKDAPSEELYGMRFDLFPWSAERES